MLKNKQEGTLQKPNNNILKGYFKRKPSNDDLQDNLQTWCFLMEVITSVNINAFILIA